MNDLIKRLRDLGLHSPNQAADRLTAMKAAGDGLAGFAGHKDGCREVLAAWGEVEACSCGLTAALERWKEAVDTV